VSQKPHHQERSQSGKPAEHHGSSPVELAAINETLVALAKKYDENNKKYPRRDWWQFVLEIAAAAGIAIYTVLTAGLLIASWYQLSDSATQIKISQDTEHRQLRAYVGFVPPSDNQIVNSFIPPAKPTIRLNPRNFGQTPAYKAKISSNIAVEDFPLPKTFAFPLVRGLNPPNPITIFPGTFDIAGIFADADRPLTQEELIAIQDGKRKRLYVWGTLDYEDAFGDLHFTNYCLDFYGVTEKQVQREPCSDHNDSN
jgi:hypothetical protein